MLTATAAVLAGLGVPSFAAWLLKRVSLRDDRREALIEALRKALDKGRVRENAYCGALDAIVMGIDHLADPPPALIAARARALEIMEAAHCQIRGA
jgi:hypothetical protein